MKLWGVLAFGLIGAIATNLAGLFLPIDVGNVASANSQPGLFSGHVNRLNHFGQHSRRKVGGDTGSGCRWPKKRRWREWISHSIILRERIKQMQSVFNRERNKHRRGCDGWKENETGDYNQQFQCDDWYWKAEASFRNQCASSQGAHTPQQSAPHPSSHHHSVLGLDRSRKTPYTDAEIKRIMYRMTALPQLQTAFRAKAMDFHPDQNQSKKVGHLLVS